MKRFNILIYLFIFLISVSTKYGQSATIKGVVSDSLSGNTLIGANVFISGTSLGAATDDEGAFIIKNITPGQYNIKVSYIGYETVEAEFDLSEPKTYEQNFYLNYTTIEGRTVQVTAQARGQMDAINKQLKAKSIKNIVSSDRIQELPDANAAETVARIPGVSIRREGGEGNKVVIRGLSPKYNKITVDGTNVPSTDMDDRSTDLSMISQYMLDGIEVTKAGTPDQEGDALGGIVNFKLRKAKPGLHFNIVTQGMVNELKNTSDDYKLVWDISNRFLNDKLGLLIQFDNEKRNRGSEELQAGYGNAPAFVDSVNQLKLTDIRLADISRTNDRKNSLFVVDFNIPNGNLSYSGLNSKIDKYEIYRADHYPVTNDYRNYNTGEGNVDINVITESWKYEQNILPNLKIDLYKSFSSSENNNRLNMFNAHKRYGYGTIYESSSGADSVVTILPSDKSTETIQNYIIPWNKGDRYAHFQRYDNNQYYTKEKENALGFNLEYDLKVSNQISGKIKIGSKSKTKKRDHNQNYQYAYFGYVAIQSQRDSTYKHFPWLGEVVPLGTIDPSYGPFIDYDYKTKKILDGKYTIGPFLNLDRGNELLDFWSGDTYFTDSFYHENITHHSHKTNSKIYDYWGKEEYQGNYVMTDLNIGSKLNIVTGLRTETNTTTYYSFVGLQGTLPHFSAAGADSLVESVRKNTYELPALFLKYDVFDWLSLRYASTKTLTRPNYTDIRPFYHIEGAGRKIQYSNPSLTPGVSTNTDYVISINNDKLGLLTLSVFQKDIEGLIYSGGNRYIVRGTADSLYGLPEYADAYQIYDYKTNNPYPVKLSGFEIDYQTRFWYLPGMLSGFVFNANYTKTTSEVKYPRTTIGYDFTVFPLAFTNTDSFYVDRLIDQPNDIINLSLGYDYKGFSGRLSMLYMSDVFISTDFWPGLRQTTDAYRRYDLSMKQKLPLKGLELYLNISNLNEAVDINRMSSFNPKDPDFDESILADLAGASDKPIEDRLDMIPRSSRAKSLEQHYGRTIDIGFRYNF